MTNNLDQELDKITENLFYAGLGSGGMDDIEDADDRDKAILNMKAHYTTEAKQAIQHLITTQKQELLSEIEKELPELALITNDDGGIDLARKSAANNVLDQVKSIITTKREEI